MSNRRTAKGDAAVLLGSVVARNISADPLPVGRLVVASHQLRVLEKLAGHGQSVLAARAHWEKVLAGAAWEISQAVPAFLLAQAVTALAGHGDIGAAADALEAVRADAAGLPPEPQSGRCRA